MSNSMPFSGISNQDFQPGDDIIIPPGRYSIGSDDPIKVTGSGTALEPVLIRAEKPGTVVLEGYSAHNIPLMEIAGNHFTFINLDFQCRVETAPDRALYRPIGVIAQDGLTGTRFVECNFGPVQGDDDEILLTRDSQGAGDCLLTYNAHDLYVSGGSVTAIHRPSHSTDYERQRADGISIRGEADTNYTVTGVTFGDAPHGALNLGSAQGYIYRNTFRNRVGYGVGQWDGISGPTQYGGYSLSIVENQFLPGRDLFQTNWQIKVAYRTGLSIQRNHVSPHPLACQINAGPRSVNAQMEDGMISDNELHGLVEIGRFIEGDGSELPQINDVEMSTNFIKALKLIGDGSFEQFVNNQYEKRGFIFDSNTMKLDVRYYDRLNDDLTHYIDDYADLDDIAGFRRSRRA